MRMVFDTNVIISTLVFTSSHTRLLRQNWAAARLIPVVSKSTVEELLAVLSYAKFKLSIESRDLLLAEYLTHAEVCGHVKSFKSKYPCSDLNDQMFIDLALSSDVVALVSGDADIQSMQATFPMPIYTLSELSSHMV